MEHSKIIELFFTTLHNGNIPVWEFWTLTAIFILAAIFILTFFLVKIFANIKNLQSQIKFYLESSKKDYKPQVYKERDITELLGNIRKNTNSDRVLVFQYHNGDKSIANNSLLKFSCTHENISANVTSVQRHIYGQSSSLLGNWNIQLFDNENLSYEDIKDLHKEPENRSLYQFLTSFGMESVYAFPITDATGKTFGVGIIDYSLHSHELDPKEIRWLHSRFSDIGTMLAGAGNEKN